MAESENTASDSHSDSMSFWHHLAELRNTLLHIAILVGVLFVGFFIFMPEFFDAVILAPCSPDFPTYRLFDHISGDGVFIPDLSASSNDISLININLGTQLITQMSASMWMACLFGFPFIIYRLWLFISPGLYPREKRGARKAFIFGNIMFYTGMTVAYFLIFPLILRFLSGYQLSERIANTITLDSYMETFYLINLSFGIIFELPLLTWLLGRIGILSRGFFSRYRRHAIVGMLILAALITPTGDPFTLIIVFIPLYSLWELSARLVPPSDDDTTPDSAENIHSEQNSSQNRP